MSFGFDFNFGGFGGGFGFGGGGGLGGANLGVPSVFGIGTSLQLDPATSVAATLAAIEAQRIERGEPQPTAVIPIDPAIGTPVTIEETVGFPVEPPLNGDGGAFGGGFGTGPGLPRGVLDVGDLLASIDTGLRTTLGGFLNVGVIDDIADLTVAIGGIGRGVGGSPGNIVIDQFLGLTGPRGIDPVPSRGPGPLFEGGRFGFGPIGDLAIGLARQVLFPEPDAPRQQAGFDIFNGGLFPQIGEFLGLSQPTGGAGMGCGPVVPVAPRAGFPRSLIIPFQDQFGKQKVKFYRDRGQPILFTGDRAVVRSWNRVVGPSRRIGTGHRKRRRR